MEGVTCLNFFPAQLTRGSATAGRVQQPQKGIKMAPSPQHCIWLYVFSELYTYLLHLRLSLRAESAGQSKAGMQSPKRSLTNGRVAALSIDIDFQQSQSGQMSTHVICKLNPLATNLIP